MRCAYCNMPIEDEAHFCSQCGQALAPATVGETLRLTPGVARSCPLCAGMLEPGFIPDEYRDRNEQSVWVRGEPQREPASGAVLLEHADMWWVETWRCAGCGYLLSFALRRVETG